MKLGMAGQGRMGAGMTRRLRAAGHEVVAFDLDPARSDVPGLPAMVAALPPPRVAWLMLPAGDATETAIAELAPLLSAGDILVDGGNSNHKDDVRRGATLAARGIRYLDAGVSGGIWGFENGFCIMAGGPRDAFDHIEPVLRALAPEGGLLYAGPHGAGHFAKMVHNGIEYGMMQAFAEGFALLDAAPEYGYDLPALAHLWQHGSVVRSWLLDLLASALDRDPHLDALRGYVDDSGEGRWTVIEGVERGVNVNVLATALFARFTSREEDSFAMRVNAALRNEFGGHAVQGR
ncbi:MAG: decarboxylating 6-phosphogluconate dehydrogenase [Dehalococcoidia bacterium]|nr:decarboxylating 6-phosphogluconate dehydrogenase [Dehalococcoidia bacterium]